MIKVYKVFASLLSIAILVLLTLTLYVQAVLPDYFYVAQGEDFSIKTKLGITPSISTNGFPSELYEQPGNSYNVNLKMFGSIGIKEVQVQVVQRRMVIPGGNPFGIKMFTDGVMVVGMSDIQSDSTSVNPAKQAGIKVGDIIIDMNNKKVTSNEDVSAVISESGGKPVSIKLRRQDTAYNMLISPVKCDSDGLYKAGIWVRDSSAGIGTMTYYDPLSDVFGGLGHAICDIDTGDIMPLDSGEIVDVNISGVNKGESGIPGELRGGFTGNSVGALYINNETGVFGIGTQPPVHSAPIPMAMRHEITPGKATILCTLSGNKPQEYEIQIEKVNISDTSPTKNMIINVTDPQLLAKTGGIVQGMSGSPIIQNGKLVGAVTHVFVNDPTRGYGIFAENMQKSSQIVEQITQKAS